MGQRQAVTKRSPRVQERGPFGKVPDPERADRLAPRLWHSSLEQPLSQVVCTTPEITGGKGSQLMKMPTAPLNELDLRMAVLPDAIKGFKDPSAVLVPRSAAQPPLHVPPVG
jgi:hypothetical protein